MKNKTALIVGGSGFLGIWLSKFLIELETKIIIIARNDLSIDKKKILKNNIEVRKLDILKNNFKSNDKIDYIFYYPLIHNESQPYNLKLNISLRAIKNYLIYAKEHDIKFILASTGSVYGEKRDYINENDVCNPITQHGKISLNIENLTNKYIKEDLNGIIFRYFFPYGKYQNKKQFIPMIINKMQNNEIINIRGSLNDLRTYTYIEDAIKSSILLCSKTENFGKIFNISSGISISISDIINTISTYYNIKPKINISNREMGDHPIILGDNKKLIKSINYKFLSFEEGFKKYYKGF